MDLLSITNPIIIYLRPKLEELEVKPLNITETIETFSKKNRFQYNSKHLVSRENSLRTEVKLERNDIKPLLENRPCTTNRYFCKFCSKSYVRKYDLRKHYLSHTKEKLLPCNTCNKKFTQVAHLKRHCLTHVKEKLYKCSVCDQSFSQRCHMKRHFLVHTILKPFRCNLCIKGFYRKDALTKHYRTHTQDKPHTCELCNKTFGRKCYIRRHYLTHTNEKPFSCEMCSKAFADKNTLTRHFLIHTHDTSFLFDEPFVESSSNILDVSRADAREKPYSCDLCNKTFSRGVALKRHRLSHTEEIVL